MSNTGKFFENLLDHSEIKLRILSKFFPPWRAKLGFKVTTRGGSQLWYVDGFAGKGRYGDGREGSPMIGAHQALSALTEGRSYAVGCINVELNPSNYRDLQENTHEFRDKGVTLHNLAGDFSSRIEEIARIIGDDSPVLLFVDPFGISPLNFKALDSLLRRRGELDLVLTFITPAVSRLAVEHPEKISWAIGTNRWPRPGTTSNLTEDVLSIFRENLKRSGNFMDVVAYPVRPSLGSSPRYHLLFASRAYDAFELLNDAVCAEEDFAHCEELRSVGPELPLGIRSDRTRQRSAGGRSRSLGSF